MELTFAEDPLLFDDMEEIEIRLRVALVQKKANRKLLSSQAETENTEVPDLEEQTRLTDVTLIAEEVICSAFVVYDIYELFFSCWDQKKLQTSMRRSSKKTRRRKTG